MVIKMLNQNQCVICWDSISDPVCKGCYIKQIEILLNDLNLEEGGYEIVLRKIKKQFPNESLNNIDCILCGKDNVAICRYCFSIILTNILIDLNFSEEVIENFGFNSVY